MFKKFLLSSFLLVLFFLCPFSLYAQVRPYTPKEAKSLNQTIQETVNEVKKETQNFIQKFTGPFKETEENNKNDNKKNIKSPQYKPGEVIVKFKSEIAKRIDSKLNSRFLISEKDSKVFQEEELFRGLNNLSPIAKVEPLLKSLKSKEISEGKSTVQVLQELKKKYPNRLPPKFPEATPELGNIYKITFQDKKADIFTIIELLKKNPQVEYAEPNYLVKTTQAPPVNDPFYPQQWALPKIKAPETWEYIEEFPPSQPTGEVFLDQAQTTGSRLIKLQDFWAFNTSLVFSPKNTGRLSKIKVELKARKTGTYTIFAKLNSVRKVQTLVEGSVKVNLLEDKPTWVTLDLEPRPVLRVGYPYHLFLYLRPSSPWDTIYWKGKNFKLYLEKINPFSESSPLTVAVIDTGIDYHHEDLKENIWKNQEEIADNGIDDDGNFYIDDIYGWDFTDNDNDPMDERNHGTHVAGIIGAKTNNLKGIASLPKELKLMNLRILDASGEGYFSDAILALEYAVDNGAIIINNSWGGWGFSQALEDALSFAYNAGCIIVASSGNNASNIDDYWYSIASSPKVIAVSASDREENRAWFSNYGVKIDVAAPGDDILSTLLNNSYGEKSGTSMAAPYVSSLAALIKSLRPNFTNEEIRQVIRASADDILDSGWDIYSGFGRINAERAVKIDSVITTKITSPMGTVRGMVEIKGIVSGNSLLDYKVEISPFPSLSWKEIASGNTSSSNERILATLDTSLWPNGKYLIKLSAKNKENISFVDIILLNFDNLRKTCFVSVSPPSILEGGNLDLSVQGKGNNPDEEIVRLWLEKTDGSRIFSPPSFFEEEFDKGIYFYKVTSCVSKNSQECESKVSVNTLPVGKYYLYCDLPKEPPPKKCSGNPFCNYNGGELDCSGWIPCSSSDHQTFEVKERSGGTKVSVTPTYQSIEIGNNVSVDIEIENVDDLYGYALKIIFDKEKLEVQDADQYPSNGIQVRHGDFLPRQEGWVVLNTADNNAGTIDYVFTFLGPKKGRSGGGKLISIDFKTKGVGSSPIRFNEVTLSDSTAHPIPVALLEHGIIEILPLGVTPTPTVSLIPTPTLTPTPTLKLSPTLTSTPTPSLILTPTSTPRPNPSPTLTPTPVVLTWNAALDYSSMQGYRNWYYQYFDGTNYKDMVYGKTWWGVTQWWIGGSDKWCSIWKDGMHPCIYESVRKWVSPVSGRAQITGTVKKGDIGGGDGVRFSIWKNNQKLYEKELNYNDNVGFEYNLSLAISQNDALYFRLHQRGQTDYNDSTIVNPTIRVTSF